MRISDWSSDVCSSDLPGLETIKKFEIGRRQAGEQGAFAELQGFELQTGYRRDGLRQHIEQTHEFVATASLQQSKLLTELRREIHDTSLVREDLLIARDIGSVLRGDRTLQAECFDRSEEHTSELQSLMRISYAVF